MTSNVINMWMEIFKRGSIILEHGENMTKSIGEKSHSTVNSHFAGIKIVGEKYEEIKHDNKPHRDL
jgi:hypothetical protein